MQESEDKENSKKIRPKITTIPIPIHFEGMEQHKKISIISNHKPSLEKLINQAFHYQIEGNSQKAAKYYQYIINQNHDDPGVFVNYAIILNDLRKYKKAEILTRQAIKIRPDFADAHLILGNILLNLKKFNEAEISTRQAIQLNPNLAIAHNNLGQILLSIGKLYEAKVSTLKAIELKPNLVIAHNNLGKIFLRLENYKEAELSIRKAIKLNPNYAEAHSDLGIILYEVNKCEQAEISIRKAIKIDPNLAISHNNLGNILRENGNLKEAEISIRKAIKIDPNLASAYDNLGSTLRGLGRLEEAELLTRKAIKLKPKSSKFYTNLGNILKDRNEFEEASNIYKKAIQLDNKSSKAKEGLIACKSLICDWSDEENQQDWMTTLGIDGESVLTLGLMYLEDNPLKNLKRSRNFYIKKYYQENKFIKRKNKDKIHIGYFSADFRAHPTMYLISEILRLHDKSKFEIYLYSFPPKEDKYTRQIKNCGCIYRDIKELNDIDAIHLARNDKLDIAIDLMGYIKYNRMNIFSKRVAPIQINYLGYPGSLGANNIDYILADKIVIPEVYEKYYSEKVIKMPNCYQCNNDKKEIASETISREKFNLPKNGFIFTCFNANNKINRREFDIWMRLLIKTKESILWLYKSNEWSKTNLRKEAIKRNVDPNRLVFADYLPLKEHLARYSLGDLGLDTFNYNGHTTTSDALWSGLPVITKIGESFAARVSASIVTTLGVPELITYTDEEYEETALKLANDNDELMRLKIKIKSLRETSSLYNSEVFTRDLENKFKELLN